VCYEKFSSSVPLNRHLLTCNALTKEIYPPENSYISYDDKKAAKYASPLSLMGFAEFETKLDGDRALKTASWMLLKATKVLLTEKKS